MCDITKFTESFTLNVNIVSKLAQVSKIIEFCVRISQSVIGPRGTKVWPGTHIEERKYLHSSGTYTGMLGWWWFWVYLIRGQMSGFSSAATHSSASAHDLWESFAGECDIHVSNLIQHSLWCGKNFELDGFSEAAGCKRQRGVLSRERREGEIFTYRCSWTKGTQKIRNAFIVNVINETYKVL